MICLLLNWDLLVINGFESVVAVVVVVVVCGDVGDGCIYIYILLCFVFFSRSTRSVVQFFLSRVPLGSLKTCDWHFWYYLMPSSLLNSIADVSVSVGVVSIDTIHISDMPSLSHRSSNK